MVCWKWGEYMSFMDILGKIGKGVKDKGLGTGGSLLGLGGSALGVASTFTDDDKKAGNLGIAAGSLNTVSGLMGIGDAAKTFIQDGLNGDTDTKKTRGKVDGVLGGLGGLLAAGGGIADIFAGVGQRNGNKSMEKAGGIASGALGILNGGIGTAQGAIGIGRAIKDYKSGDIDKKKMVAALFSGGGNLLSGILGMISGGLGIWGAASDNKAAKTGGKWAAGLGATAGTLGMTASIADWFTGGD